MNMGHWWNELASETKVLGENLPLCHFICLKSDIA
jgi:hypothetical protein